MRENAPNIVDSALIFKRNEEKQLKVLLEDIVEIVDEVVIIDACSTDGTIDVARKYGGKDIWDKTIRICCMLMKELEVCRRLTYDQFARIVISLKIHYLSLIHI